MQDLDWRKEYLLTIEHNLQVELYYIVAVMNSIKDKYVGCIEGESDQYKMMTSIAFQYAFVAAMAVVGIDAIFLGTTLTLKENKIFLLHKNNIIITAPITLTIEVVVIKISTSGSPSDAFCILIVCSYFDCINSVWKVNEIDHEIIDLWRFQQIIGHISPINYAI